jgi:putative peptidoglycan lipid II flippase
VTAVPNSANRQIARAAGTIMAAFVLCNVIGLVRQNLISRAFGTGPEIDAFNVANRFPDLIFSLIAGGALASAFIPTFTGFLEKDDHPSAWRLASSIVNLVLVLLIVTSLLAALFSSQVVQYILAPGFSPPQQALTASLLRIMLLSPAIFGVSGLLMGILNSNQVFLLPALAPSMYWIGMILGVLLLVPRMGIYGLAWGVVLGAVLHLGIQLPALFRLKGKYYPTFGLDSPAVREVGWLMAPRLLGVAAVQLNFLVNVRLASGQPEGSVTAIAVAWMVVTMPQIAIAQAIAIAALPTFSAQVARGEITQMRASLAATLRAVTLLSLPASLGLILLRGPVVALLFQYGKFNAHSTDMVAWALLWYAAGLVGQSVVEILSRAFYSLHDTKTPVTVGVIAMSLNVVFSLLFSALFTRIGWAPHGGLALANSLATALEMIGLLVLMRRRLNGLDGRQLLSGGLQASAATLVMCIALGAWNIISPSLPTWLAAAGGVTVGVVVYGAIVLALGVQEVRSLVKELVTRLR